MFVYVIVGAGSAGCIPVNRMAAVDFHMGEDLADGQVKSVTFDVAALFIKSCRRNEVCGRGR